MTLRPPAWSAPSAIGLAGVGVGGQAGAEMTDFLIVLNSRSVGLPPLDPVV
jgi:lipid-binding SYLF domain-containing protein